MNRKWQTTSTKATKKAKYENPNISADANAPIQTKHKTERNFNTQTEFNILKQAFENMK